MSSYRTSYNSGLPYDDVPPPPPPLPDSPPPPPSASYPSSGGRGMRDSWRPNVPSSREFAFRNPAPGPAYPRDRDNYPDSRARPPNGSRKRQSGRPDQHRNLNTANRNNRPYGRGGRFIPVKASSRPLLHQKHGEDDDMEMLGVDVGAAKFLNLEDVDASDSDDDSSRESNSVMEYSEGFDGAADDESAEPPAKRRNVNQTNANEDEKPKWCNPDPYSEYAPVLDDSMTKRKDPVETIRKYRKQDDEKPKSSNQVADNDDFISFDLDGANSEDSEPQQNTGMPVVPTAPKSMLNGKHGGDRTGAASDIAIQTDSKDFDFVERTVSRVPDGCIILDTQPGSFRHESDRYQEYAGAGQSRKRDFAGQIRGQAVPLPSVNGLIEEWWPERMTNPLPWLSKPKYITARPGLRLHLELCDFFDFVKPQKFEEAVRESLIDRVQTLIDGIFPNCTVQCFGSFASGLYLPNADMDLVVMSDSYLNQGIPLLCQSGNKLFNFGNLLRKSGIAKDQDVTVIPKAKVPLVKFVDRKTNIKVDVSFENNSGVIALETFGRWKQNYPAMPILVTVIKQFLLMRAQNEVQHGGIGGFTATCLVTSLLQNMPRVQSGELVPENHLGEILIEFLDFYGNRFDVSRTGITMDPPGYFDKLAYNRSIISGRSGMKPSQMDRIAILDPNRANNDISGGSKNVMSIFDQFSKAHREILESMKARDRPSLLDWMLGGNYTDVMKQRNLLKELYYSDMDRRSHHHQGKVAAPSRPLGQRPKGQYDGLGSPKGETSKRPKTPPTQQRLPDNDDRMMIKPINTSQANKKPDNLDHPENPGNRMRAEDLKARFPQRTDIPKEVSKDQARELISVQEYNKERAVRLKREYPYMSGIPVSVSKVRRLQLIEAYEKRKSRTNAQSEDMVLTSHKETAEIPDKWKAVAVPARTPSSADISDTGHRSAKSASAGPTWTPVNALSGSSNSNPIQLD